MISDLLDEDVRYTPAQLARLLGLPEPTAEQAAVIAAPLREAMEPSMRLITPAVAWQIAAGVVAAYDGPVDAIEWTPRSVTTAVLHLAGELAEHLRSPADVIQVGEWLE